MARLVHRRSMAHRTVMLERFRLSLALQEIGPRPSVAAGSTPFTFRFARAAFSILSNLSATKMAAVFMIRRQPL